jgi:hypothetical protein
LSLDNIYHSIDIHPSQFHASESLAAWVNATLGGASPDTDLSRATLPSEGSTHSLDKQTIWPAISKSLVVQPGILGLVEACTCAPSGC